MDARAAQRRFFAEAYRTGEHAWPSREPSAFAVAFVEAHPPPAPGARVLDLGCGEGRHTLLFARAGYTAIGVDFEPLAVTRAREAAREAGLLERCHFLVADALALPFQPGTFSVLLDFGCLHSILKRDFSRYLRNTLPLLQPGGYYLLSCFSIHFQHYPGEVRRRDWVFHQGHYHRFFREEDFPRLFGRHYEILSVEEDRPEDRRHYASYRVLMRRRG